MARVWSCHVLDRAMGSMHLGLPKVLAGCTVYAVYMGFQLNVRTMEASFVPTVRLWYFEQLGKSKLSGVRKAMALLLEEEPNRTAAAGDPDNFGLPSLFKYRILS
eukprot:jgi/Botrbrau1/16691/Bobra.0267s0007.1